MRSKFFSTAGRRQRRGGYTLIEIILATGLALLLLVSVVRIFLMMNEGFGNSRQLMEMLGRMRNAHDLMVKDLGNYTVMMHSPRPFTADDGYLVCGTFPMNHGNVGSTNLNGLVDESVVSYSSIGGNETDLKVDRALFNSSSEGLFQCVNGYVGLTVCNLDEPFRFSDGTNQYETPYGEVAWFVYRNNLYRAFIPVVPARNRDECRVFYERSDTDWANVPKMPTGPDQGMPCYRRVNLGMLGDPRNRFISAFWNVGGSGIPPMLYGDYMASSGATVGKNHPYIWGWIYRQFIDERLAHVGDSNYLDSRKALLDNWLVLPNVIQFDVQVWDPEANGGNGQYITLGSTASSYYTLSHDYQNSATAGREDLRYAYDTWSTLLSNMSYDYSDAQLTPTGLSATGYLIGTTERFGLTNNAATRSIAAPPYTAPLPGIRIRVRAFDPDSGQVKEFHVAQDFRTY